MKTVGFALITEILWKSIDVLACDANWKTLGNIVIKDDCNSISNATKLVDNHLLKRMNYEV